MLQQNRLLQLKGVFLKVAQYRVSTLRVEERINIFWTEIELIRYDIGSRLRVRTIRSFSLFTCLYSYYILQYYPR